MYKVTFSSHVSEMHPDNITFKFKSLPLARLVVHRQFLENISPVFKVMFSDKFFKPGEPIYITFESSSFEKAINLYINEQTIQFSSLKETYELLHIAEMYELETLKTYCNGFFLEQCTLESCIFLRKVANLFNLENLLLKCDEIYKQDWSLKCFNLLPQSTVDELKHEFDEESVIEFFKINPSPAYMHYQFLEYLVSSEKLDTCEKVLDCINFPSMTSKEITLCNLLPPLKRVEILRTLDRRAKRIVDTKFPSKYFFLVMLSRSNSKSAELIFKRIRILSKIHNWFTETQLKLLKLMTIKIQHKDTCKLNFLEDIFLAIIETDKALMKFSVTKFGENLNMICVIENLYLNFYISFIDREMLFCNSESISDDETGF